MIKKNKMKDIFYFVYRDGMWYLLKINLNKLNIW